MFLRQAVFYDCVAVLFTHCQQKSTACIAPSGGANQQGMEAICLNNFRPWVCSIKELDVGIHQ